VIIEPEKALDGRRSIIHLLSVVWINGALSVFDRLALGITRSDGALWRSSLYVWKDAATPLESAFSAADLQNSVPSTIYSEC
jgi:hypothetical protein